MYKHVFKRILDLIAALIGFLILLPIILIITIILLFINNGKPFFFQSRPGKNEKVFRIIKFKTMTDKKDSNGNLLPDQKRLTMFGKFLRKTSLDEITQFINIIKGDMSLIGPRPLHVHYLPYYTETEKLRHTIKPGVTGLAQVSGRNSLGWDEKLAIDVEYVKNISLKLDIIILFKTIKKVIATENTVFEDSWPTFDEYRKKNNS